MTNEPIRTLPTPGRRLGMLISGRGSNLQAILDAIETGSLNAEVALVFSNRGKARGLEIAKTYGVPTAVLSHRAFPDRGTYDAEIVKLLREHGADLVCLAGFMRIVSPVLLNAFPDRVLNIHPSLLPAYRGANTHRRVLEAGEKHHGCSVHFVTVDLDEGARRARAGVPAVWMAVSGAPCPATPSSAQRGSRSRRTGAPPAGVQCRRTIGS